jgi:3-oxoacyl-ACP reductase-like protein
MKINGNHHHDIYAAAMRQTAKARSSEATSDGTATPAPTAPAASAAPTAEPAPSVGVSPAPIESTVAMAARKLPPGLVRVAARLEAAGVEGRTGGQSNAFTQITRNLQRYAENQGMASTPDAPTTPPTEVDPVGPEASTDTLPPIVSSTSGEGALLDAITGPSVEVAEQTPV